MIKYIKSGLAYNYELISSPSNNYRRPYLMGIQEGLNRALSIVQNEVEIEKIKSFEKKNRAQQVLNYNTIIHSDNDKQ